MIKYSQLTKKQVKIITNGCGAKAGWIKVPNFLFEASCNQHDFYYWRGHTEADKIKADKDFYMWMRLDIRYCKTVKKPYYHLWALTYYLMVKHFGKKYFSYSDTYKTLADI